MTELAANSISLLSALKTAKLAERFKLEASDCDILLSMKQVFSDALKEEVARGAHQCDLLEKKCADTNVLIEVDRIAQRAANLATRRL